MQLHDSDETKFLQNQQKNERAIVQIVVFLLHTYSIVLNNVWLLGDERSCSWSEPNACDKC